MPLVIRSITELIISIQPIIIDVVSGSPISVMPIVIAVSGSKAPRIATLAESISVSERTKVTLLIVVGINPRSISDRNEGLSGIRCTPPVVNEEYRTSSNIAIKKI